MIRNRLNIHGTHVLELEEDNLECLLASSPAILKAFPDSKIQPDELEAKLRVSPADLKAVLNSVLREWGGYTEGNAVKVAEHIKPPEKWTSFFKNVDVKDRGEK